MGIMSKKTWFSQCFLFVLFLFLNIQISKESDTLSPGQSLSGNHTLTSAGGIFELGFFTPGNSQNYYIGIWYKTLPNQTVVWVANRKEPISDHFSSELKLLEDGNLVLFNQSGAAVWSTNSTSTVHNSTTAKLLDNANFFISNALDSSGVIWQSFDHPTNHWLPGGKLGYKNKTNEEMNLVSWRSPENPAPSLFSLDVARNGTGHSHLLMWNDTHQYWNSGDWTGKIFTLVPELQLNFYVTNMTLVSNENESYFTYTNAIPNAFTRFVIEVTGQLRQYVWQENFGEWKFFWTRPTQQCEVYAFCGPFSVCNQKEEPLCVCMEGFEPKMEEDWKLEDHTDGCVRKAPLQCDGTEKKDRFLVMRSMFFQDNPESLAVGSVEECESACLSNCSCNAFAYDNGCSIWKGDLFNLQQLESGDETGRNFHLRIAESELIQTSVKHKSVKTVLIVCATIAGFCILCVLVALILWRRHPTVLLEGVDGSLVLFKYWQLRSATKNFSDKLGEGAFGSVFKGILPNSTAIAVKELKNLQEGEKQFQAEVKTVGMIQHINLVQLRGFCVKASKRFLVYEYMPNGSLESLLFRRSSRILDWQSRFKIATGTARGLAYLHEKCRECIIHCDIKPENILLDAEYNPKVADFGLAKLFGREFSRVLTTMRGTRGYLAPEWISGEAVTPKADVFSYGMLLFEVISGRRNVEKLENGFHDYFPSWVAKTVQNGEDVLALLDDRLEGNAITEELNRACKVACWCIQDDEKDRPTMGQVVQILEGVTEVSIPPMPRLLQHLTENPSEVVPYQETSTTES
ncbi:hypothetical protein LWI28_021347 [Acer negundo]|uniref:Receptor-like serine/threonine-protein kinase n=1 Tax=Acer negundo TaxID=4023 RepID=A0AAD5NS09_ACENE|nr:hypothetical protein LWI28_021347 [Acer negundo]